MLTDSRLPKASVAATITIVEAPTVSLAEDEVVGAYARLGSARYLVDEPLHHYIRLDAADSVRDVVRRRSE